MRNSRPGVLLCDATYYGTLAAVRSLGRAGISVVVADADRAAPALWSRYAATRRRCPPVMTADRFTEWLLGFGEREGAHVLYPTSDEVVYLLSAHRDELSKRFVMYQPDLETTMRVLDKKRLVEAATKAGLDTPETWFPENAADVERVARDVDGPLMLKPRTQLFLYAHRKGDLAPQGPTQMRVAYEKFSRDNRFLDPIAKTPDLTRPMLQRYYPEAAECIYSLSGFRDKSGRHVALLGAIKVLQRPRRMGVGLCFEDAPVPGHLPERALRLLDLLGYYGVFELEFVRAGDRLLLIDMNPRYFGQIGLDVARGLDLPLLSYAAAVGDDDHVARLVAAAAVASNGTPHAFCNRMGLNVLVGAQRLFGTMSPADAARWFAWAQPNGKVLVDAVDAADDRGPLLADAVRQLYDCVRHPRAFVRMIALDRS
jgi:predicted ATP-grasp superfamily ATP-dependent carboligase